MKRSPGRTDTLEKAPEQPADDPRAARRAGIVRWTVIGVLILALFAVAAVIGGYVRNYKGSQLTPPSAAAGSPSLAVPVYGHAPVTITLYEDMRDPQTLKFYQTFDATLNQLVSSGTANVYYREVANVDKAVGGHGSLYAGNALGCAQDVKAGDFTAFRQVLMENQPADESDDLFGSKGEIKKLAKQVDGLDNDTFQYCVDQGSHNVWVKDSTSNFNALGQGGVPVLQLQVRGETQPTTVYGSGNTSLTPAQLSKLVMKSAATAPPSAAASSAASPSPSA